MAEGHHIWCNNQYGPIEDCDYCKPREDGTGLWQAHPYGEAKTSHELMARDFPANVPLSPDFKLP